MRAGSSVSLSAITKGENIGAAGTLNSDGSLNAEVVTIQLPHVGGQITSINGYMITVRDPRGTHTIEVSSSTIFMNDQTQQRISLSNLSTGENIHAEGSLNSNGTLSAEIVHLGPTPAARPAASTSGTPSTSATPNGSSTPISNGSGS